MPLVIIAFLKLHALKPTSLKSRLLNFVSGNKQLSKLVISKITPEKSQVSKVQLVKLDNFRLAPAKLHLVKVSFSNDSPFNLVVKSWFLYMIFEIYLIFITKCGDGGIKLEP